ncbi:MAG: hypothetical protein ACSLFM_10085, partial [Tepidiformaceae bacterium]
NGRLRFAIYDRDGKEVAGFNLNGEDVGYLEAERLLRLAYANTKEAEQALDSLLNDLRGT